MSNDKWREQAKNSVSDEQLANISSFNIKAKDLFPQIIPSFLAQNINFNDDFDPILNQVMPKQAEFNRFKSYHDDPVGDIKASPVTGVIHKYHGRVLLIATGICAVNCRYCFRRNFDYLKNYASKNNWKKAIEYIQDNNDINEVILSGGDPLMLSTRALKNLTDQLEKIQHLKTLRIHTRIPLVTPSRINTNFLNWLKNISLKKVMVLHCNHSNELQAELKDVFSSIIKTNTLLFNQSVLLRNINDEAQILADLSHKLFDFGVIPYYLNQLDKANGTKHFRVKNTKAKSIHKKVRQILPGYLVPKLVEEISGKLNKSPLI